MKRRWLGALLACALCAACAPTSRTHTSKSGNARSRIVALVPFVADDLYALDAGSCVVAVSAYTDEPAARSLPRVADFSSVDSERIVALHPDAVVGLPSQARLVEPLRRAGIEIVLLPDDDYASVFTNLRTIGGLCGKDKEARALVGRLKRTTAQLHVRALTFRRRPSVFVVLGSGPIWTAGSRSYIATLVALAGGRNSAADLQTAYGQYSSEALLRAQPDMLVTDPAIHLDAVLSRQPWRSLRAVRLHRVYTVTPADIIQRPGPRYNEGIRWLLDRLAPLAT